MPIKKGKMVVSIPVQVCDDCGDLCHPSTEICTCGSVLSFSSRWIDEDNLAHMLKERGQQRLVPYKILPGEEAARERAYRGTLAYGILHSRFSITLPVRRRSS